MMKSIANSFCAKAASARGESITEVLVAIVVSGLAILMLATVIATAASTNQTGKKAMGDYYDANNRLVTATAASGAAGDETGEVSLTTQDGATVPLVEGESAPVDYYISQQADGTPVVSYELREG